MKVVTVHRGARDAYQVSWALQEAGLLERLITDLYWAGDRPWAQILEEAVPRVSRALRCRYANGLPSAAVRTRAWSGLLSLFVHQLKWLPAHVQSQAIRWCDHDLGRTAARVANRSDSALLSYSYYGHSAFSSYCGQSPRILFQLHPHPAAVRTILRRERELHPDCASSLDSEWELLLPEADFERLVKEVSMAESWIVASSFTKRTLLMADIPQEQIHVVPYGVDLTSFVPKEPSSVQNRPLRLLFVGTLGQRKGIKYLLEALRLLPREKVELTMCGRPVDDLTLIRNSGLAVNVLPSVSSGALREEYRRADLFVFPSLAEGFGQVLLEALASGLPVISTDRTAALDLIREGSEGYIVPAGSAREIAASVMRFCDDPEKVPSMSRAAHERAKQFTWQYFRQRIVQVATTILHGQLCEPQV